MFSNHQKKVEERFNQLKLLNEAIASRNNEIILLDTEINHLKAIVGAFKNNHPGLSEKEAALNELQEIKKEIAKAKIELAKLKAEHSSLNDIINIEEEKTKLQEELANLQEQKTEIEYHPRDIIIAAYTVPNIDDIAIDAFIFDKKIKYNDKDTNYRCTGAVYKSLGGGRIIGFSSEFGNSLSDTSEPTFNAYPKKFVTFEEACLAIGSDLYLKETVTAQEIHKILMYFRSGFYFYGKTNITLDEFMEMIKTERQDIGSKPLELLLEKGKTE